MLVFDGRDLSDSADSERIITSLIISWYCYVTVMSVTVTASLSMNTSILLTNPCNINFSLKLQSWTWLENSSLQVRHVSRNTSFGKDSDVAKKNRKIEEKMFRTCMAMFGKRTCLDMTHQHSYYSYGVWIRVLIIFSTLPMTIREGYSAIMYKFPNYI